MSMFDDYSRYIASLNENTVANGTVPESGATVLSAGNSDAQNEVAGNTLPTDDRAIAEPVQKEELLATGAKRVCELMCDQKNNKVAIGGICTGVWIGLKGTKDRKAVYENWIFEILGQHKSSVREYRRLHGHVTETFAEELGKVSPNYLALLKPCLLCNALDALKRYRKVKDGDWKKSSGYLVDIDFESNAMTLHFSHTDEPYEIRYLTNSMFTALKNGKPLPAKKSKFGMRDNSTVSADGGEPDGGVPKDIASEGGHSEGGEPGGGHSDDDDSDDDNGKKAFEKEDFDIPCKKRIQALYPKLAAELAGGTQ